MSVSLSGVAYDFLAKYALKEERKEYAHEQGETSNVDHH